MRYLALALALVACEPLVRSAADEAPLDAGTLTVSVLELNGALITPGVIAKIAPNSVATSPKFYLRKASGNAPDCWYGVFIADPTAAGNGLPNNGVLLSALGDMAAINGDPTLGEGQRTSCPYPESYPVGGNIPDGVLIGDQLAITGYFEPFCNYYDTSVGQCSSDLFPEFSPDSPFPGNPDGVVTDVGPTTPIPPVIVQPSQVSDLALNAIQYAGELVEVQNVTVASSDDYGDVIMEQSSLWVTPEISSVSVNPTVGTAFCSITGNLHYYGEASSHWDVRPRSAADIVAAPCP